MPVPHSDERVAELSHQFLSPFLPRFQGIQQFQVLAHDRPDNAKSRPSA